MADIDWLVAEVENGPQGPEVGAFFDFDGTLIDGYSAMAFFRERLKNREIDSKELVATLVESVNVERRGHDIDRLMEVAVAAQEGKSIEDLQNFGRQLFQTKIASMIYPDARKLINAHRSAGHTVVLASSATPPQVSAAAEDLEIPYILCTELESLDGLITGLVSGPIRWGEAKADAVIDFAAEHDIDLDLSYTYSNGSEDVPFLESTGNPRPLNPDEALVATATERGWPVARFTMPHRHNPITLARSAGALAGLMTGIGVGLAMGAINRNRRVGAEVAATVGSELALATAGVKLNVVGQENLWNSRPAVFLFNHQSQLDVFVLASLLRQDFSGVAKIQLKSDPFFAPIGYLTEIAYVDRANPEKAREALRPAVEMLKNGRSLAIAPEGTRSATPKLLPFKKGAFHMAMQAGVPVVPIVMRNAGDIMRPHSYVISSGTVDVAVLPPVSSDGWNHDNLGEVVEQVRNMYIQTMEHWPTSV